MNEKTKKYRIPGLRESAGWRLIIVGFLTLVLLVPAAMVTGLINERQLRRDNAVREVSEKWGGSQTIAGPILTVPYLTWYKDSSGELHSSRKYAHYLPEVLSITGDIASEVRYRGIYEVILYSGKVRLTGRFSKPDLGLFDVSEKDILMEDSFISVGITDMKGIREIVDVQWAGSPYSAEPGTGVEETLNKGVSVRVPFDVKSEAFTFSIGLDLRGSEQIRFIPVGKETTAVLSSDWNTPSFEGGFLPDKRNVTPTGFTADWKVLHLNRSYPQSWIGGGRDLDPSAFGVKLMMPVDNYQRTMRTAKYAFMFISLTFLAFFIIEILNGKAIHPIQYLLIGSALVIFYTLLLSLSEHILFNASYMIAGSSIVVMIGLYTMGVLKNRKLALLVSGLVTVLYGFLFVVLQAQDYALLIGSLGLFAILGLIMYLTRKVDWYNVLSSQEQFEVLPG